MELYTSWCSTIYYYFTIWTNTCFNLNKYIWLFGQIHVVIWINTLYYLDKYTLQFEKIHFTIWRPGQCYHWWSQFISAAGCRQRRVSSSLQILSSQHCSGNHHFWNLLIGNFYPHFWNLFCHLVCPFYTRVFWIIFVVHVVLILSGLIGCPGKIKSFGCFWVLFNGEIFIRNVLLSSMCPN